jgi:hypothetical protein
MHISKILAGIEAAETMERKIEALAKPFVCQLAAYETVAEKCARQFAPYQAAADRIADQFASCQAAADRIADQFAPYQAAAERIADQFAPYQAAADRIADQFAPYQAAAERFARQHADIEAMISSSRTWYERNPEPDFARIMPSAMPVPLMSVTRGPEVRPRRRSIVRPEVKRRVGYHWE